MVAQALTASILRWAAICAVWQNSDDGRPQRIVGSGDSNRLLYFVTATDRDGGLGVDPHARASRSVRTGRTLAPSSTPRRSIRASLHVQMYFGGTDDSMRNDALITPRRRFRSPRCRARPLRRVERSMPGSPHRAPRHAGCCQLAGGLMTGGPNGGKAGPPSERFITVQDSDIPRAAKTKMT